MPICTAAAPSMKAAAMPRASVTRAGGDHRHRHRIDDLRHQREGARLRGDVVAEKDAAMAARLIALRDDRIDAALLQPARFGDCRRGTAA